MSQQNALRSKQNRGEVSPSKQVRKLKADLSDRIFQIKKMEEDYAQEKALLFIQFNNERNSLNSTIRQLRQKMQYENQHWASKIDEMRRQNIAKVEEINCYWESRVEQEIKCQVAEKKQLFLAEIEKLKQQTEKSKQLKLNEQKIKQKAINNLVDSHRSQIGKLKQEYQLKMHQMKKIMAKDEQMKISAVIHIKNTQQQEFARARSLLIKKDEEIEKLTKSYRQRLANLELKISELLENIQRLNRKIESQTQEFNSLTMLKNKEFELAAQEWKKKIESVQLDWKQHVNSINEKWKFQYKKMQSAFEKITSACAEKERLWQERGAKVLKLYEIRDARQEDVKLIQQLEVQLIKKQFELQREKQQLKSCKLQLDNMDDIYKRVFQSVRKNHRNSFQLKKMRLPGIVNRSTHPIKLEHE